MHLRLEVPAQKRDSLYSGILEASHADLEYITMLALAGLIALFGLLQNSVAVIIGAMLISPLMNPILASGLALLRGDWELGRKSTLILASSIAGVILITWIASWLCPLNEVTPEIMARTNPNLLDLLIAVLSGLAGTLALRGGSSSLTIIPGVAIAVAVVPPLAVVGYGLSVHQGGIAGGAFLLFFTNLVSIIISAAVVFSLVGFRPKERPGQERFRLRHRMTISAVILILLSIPLFQTLRKAAGQVRLKSEISEVLDLPFNTPHSRIADLTISREKDDVRVKATVRTTQYFDKSAIDKATGALHRKFGPGSRLEIDQILVAQGGLSAQQVSRLKDFISGGVIQAPPREAPYDLMSNQEKLLAYLQKEVSVVFEGTPLRQTAALRAEMGGQGPLSLNLQLQTPSPLEPQTLAILASQLATKFSTPVDLHGKSLLTGDAYQLMLHVSQVKGGLSPADRATLQKFLQVGGQASGLHLEGQFILASTDLKDPSRLPAWREVETSLSRSRMKRPQWSLQWRALQIVPGSAAGNRMAPEKGPLPIGSGLTIDLRYSQVF